MGASKALPVLLALVGCVAGCDRVLNLGPIEAQGCGDGVLAATEECEDGADASGDGCSSTCMIEPGFECPASSPVCLPVVGLVRDPISTSLGVAAGEPTMGNPFTFACPPDEIVIGFEGYADQVGDNLGTLTVMCGSLALTATGDGLFAPSSEQLIAGSETGSLRVGLCAQDEVATGFLPNLDTYVSGFQWMCQQVSHRAGALVFGATRLVSFGPSSGIDDTERSCAPGEVVSSVFGTVGLSIDSMGLGCSALSTVVCGDGDVAPPEQCDDGNLTRGDGCGRRCELE